MSRVKRIRNEAGFPIEVKHSDGMLSVLPPGGVLENVDIKNLSEVREQALVTLDLGEIMESDNTGSQMKLYD
jgi:hypothetical protein